MNILAKLFDKLRRGTATPAEIENLDRRLFCLGAVASGTLLARPTFVDLGHFSVRQDRWWMDINGQQRMLTPDMVSAVLYEWDRMRQQGFIIQKLGNA